jgi:hypothetical protein
MDSFVKLVLIFAVNYCHIFSKKLHSILPYRLIIMFLFCSLFNLSAGGSQDRTGRWTTGLAPCLAPGKTILFVTKKSWWIKLRWKKQIIEQNPVVGIWASGDFLLDFFYHCLICRPSDSTVLGVAGSKQGMLRLWHWQSDALTTRVDLIQPSLFTSSLPL